MDLCILLVNGLLNPAKIFLDLVGYDKRSRVIKNNNIVKINDLDLGFLLMVLSEIKGTGFLPRPRNAK